MKINLFVLLLSIVSFPVFAEDAYKIDLEISVNNSLLGSPSIAVHSGKEAKVTTQDYELSLTAMPSNDDQVSISTSLTIGAEVVKPTFLVKLGQASSVSIGETTLRIIVQRYADEKT